jgi:hypothetical protein
MARKKPGAYVALSAHYADDDRIMAAGEDAELLYVRALAYCARTPKTEGHLTHAQIKFRLGLDGAESRAEKCAEVGLLVRTDSGYRIASWLKWNLSAEEIERVRTQDRHRKATPPTSAKSGSGSGKRSGSDGVTDAGIPVPYTETDTETETTTVARKRATQIPVDWEPKPVHLEIAVEYNLDPAFQLRSFRDYYQATGKTHKDWDAAFRVWLNKAKSFQRPAPRQSGPDWDAAMQRAEARTNHTNHLEIA